MEKTGHCLLGQGAMRIVNSLASIVVKEDADEPSPSERDIPGGGSVRRSLSSFCILKFNLAAWAIETLTVVTAYWSKIDSSRFVSWLKINQEWN